MGGCFLASLSLLPRSSRGLIGTRTGINLGGVELSLQSAELKGAQ